MMDGHLLQGLRSRLGLGANATVRNQALNADHEARNAALMAMAGAGNPAVATVLTIPGANFEKFMWGVHGFPPADDSPWTMVDS